MDKNEFSTFVMALQTYYQKEQILPNEAAMKLWYRELKDIPFPVAELALRKWVNTNKWSPSIAELREMAVDIQYGESLTWGESWERAVGAIRKYGSYRQKEALESLDPITRKCVESLGYRELCMSENAMADRANFRMIFETVSNREKMRKQICLPLQEAIGLLQMKDDNGMYRIGHGKED